MLAAYTIDMIHIWNHIVDSIFPPSPSLIILRQYSDTSYSTYYEPHQVSDTIALSRYQSPLIKASITAGKFEHNLEALKDLGALLRTHLAKQSSIWTPEHTLLVPIPLHPKRARERGYNQVEVILHAATKHTAWRVVPLLKKTHNVSPQSHLKRAERLTHLNDVFAYAPVDLDWDHIHTVILTDDVVTTGSTLETARKLLVNHLPKHVMVQTLAIAH